MREFGGHIPCHIMENNGINFLILVIGSWCALQGLGELDPFWSDVFFSGKLVFNGV